MIYSTPIPVLEQIIPPEHFLELEEANDCGMLPDDCDKINAIANVIAAVMGKVKEPIDIRPKIPELPEERKKTEQKLENLLIKKRMKLTWRT